MKITITITGTNDAPEITHADAEKLITGVEGGVLSAEGTITATDVDRDDAGKMEDLTARFDNGTDTMVASTARSPWWRARTASGPTPTRWTRPSWKRIPKLEVLLQGRRRHVASYRGHKS